jgi:hypothetical protein
MDRNKLDAEINSAFSKTIKRLEQIELEIKQMRERLPRGGPSYTQASSVVLELNKLIDEINREREVSEK